MFKQEENNLIWEQFSSEISRDFTPPAWVYKFKKQPLLIGTFWWAKEHQEDSLSDTYEVLSIIGQVFRPSPIEHGVPLNGPEEQVYNNIQSGEDALAIAKYALKL